MIKQNQCGPQMEMHTQKQLSKNVVQHPTLGYHHPAWQTVQRLGGWLLKRPGTQQGDATAAVPSAPVSMFPNRPTIDTFHQHPGSLAPFPPRPRARCVILEISPEGPGAALPLCPGQHFSLIHEASELQGARAGHPGRKTTHHNATRFVLSLLAQEGSC